MDVIKRGVVELFSEAELKAKLEKSLKEKRPLRVKAGFDPTRPDIHLGHTVLLRKLRQFQELGHHVVYIIGDFTGRIGDPSGQSAVRKQLTKEEVEENARSYQDQAFRILDRKKTEVIYNSKWFESMGLADILRLTSRTTVAQMLARDDFKKRYQENTDISILEFLYPLLQGYDSVMVKADVELGGTDQLFNLLMGREIQRDYGQESQIVITMPLLVGLDGKNKMSKSLGNYVGVTESADQMFGKLMSIPDPLMKDYYCLLTDRSLDEKEHPKEAKENLARLITAGYHGGEAADRAKENFDKKHVSRTAATDAGAFKEVAETRKLDWPDKDELWICEAITASGGAASNSAARRLIEQGAVYLDGVKVEEINLQLSRKRALEKEYLLKVGKIKFYRIIPARGKESGEGKRRQKS